MRCPFCRSKKVAEHGHRTYVCARCNAWFDDDPDEGGDYFSDPTKRMTVRERQEQRAKRAKKRR